MVHRKELVVGSNNIVTVPPDQLGGLGRELGRGGQATVFELPKFTLPDAPGALVYKRYHVPPPTAADLRKIVSLRGGLDPVARARLDAIASWPCRIVQLPDGTVSGVILPRIPTSFMDTIDLPVVVAGILGTAGLELLSRAVGQIPLARPSAREWSVHLSRLLGDPMTRPSLGVVALDRSTALAGHPVEIEWRATDAVWLDVVFPGGVQRVDGRPAEKAYQSAQSAANCELDGSCDSGARGKGEAYQQKQRAADDARAVRDSAKSHLDEVATQVTEKLRDGAKTQAEAAAKELPTVQADLARYRDQRRVAEVASNDAEAANTGLLARLEALNRITDDRPSGGTAHWMLFLLSSASRFCPSCRSSSPASGHPRSTTGCWLARTRASTRPMPSGRRSSATSSTTRPTFRCRSSCTRRTRSWRRARSPSTPSSTGRPRSR